VLQTSLPSNLPAVLGDEIQLQQVLLNLLLNAIEAMSRDDQGLRELYVGAERLDPNDILVTVRDQGMGLAQENLDRVFEAFYTTKRGGIGVGLSICRSIVEAHGGRIWASADGVRGATFQFSLPCVEK
jgi:signal transduction histidine kinase